MSDGAPASDRSSRRRAVVLAGLAAVAAAGVAVGVVLRRRARAAAADPYADEPFGPLTGQPLVVDAAEGVRIRAVVAGRPDAEVTAVFLHGFMLSSRCWWFQWKDFGGPGSPVRAVAYDQRAHGATGPVPAEASIDQLGDDLARVLDVACPDGPVVLVGHSMGGMTIMALADRHPELFGERVIGVALLSTAAGDVSSEFGLPKPVADRLRAVLSAGPSPARAAAIERARPQLHRFTDALFDRYSFDRHVPRSLSRFQNAMIGLTPFETFAQWLLALDVHNRTEALPVLGAVETLVLVGDHDRLTPPGQSVRISRAVSGSRLVVVPGTGHMVIMERAAEVNDELRALIDRSRRRRPAELPPRTAAG